MHTMNHRKHHVAAPLAAALLLVLPTLAGAQEAADTLFIYFNDGHVMAFPTACIKEADTSLRSFVRLHKMEHWLWQPVCMETFVGTSVMSGHTESHFMDVMNSQTEPT